jgi:hypothetical protein
MLEVGTGDSEDGLAPNAAPIAINTINGNNNIINTD